MKFNNLALENVLQSLKKFNTITGKLGYAISKMKANVIKQLQPFEEQRQLLFQKYGEKDEQSGQLKIKQDTENFQKFINELRPLAEDVNIEIDIMKISREEFENNTSLFEMKDITVEDFDLLQTLFIKEAEDKTE